MVCNIDVTKPRSHKRGLEIVGDEAFIMYSALRFCPIDWTNRNGGSIAPHNVKTSLQNRSGSAVHMLCSDAEAAKDYRAKLSVLLAQFVQTSGQILFEFFNSNLCTRVHSRLCIFYFCNFCVLHRLISLACRSHLWLGAQF